MTIQDDMSDTTHIALALHDRHGTYWPYVAVTVTSVCQHTSVPVVVHLLHDETLSDEARQVLGQIVSHYGHRLELHAVPTIESLSALDFRHFSVATAYRLILPRLLPHLPWLVYLDADIVFHGFDLARFGQWLQTQTHDHPLAAVHDDLFASFAGGRTDLHTLNLAAADYVNAGVLVMRPALIAQDLLAELPAFAARHPKVTHLDQGLLNDVFRGRIQRLPPSSTVKSTSCMVAALSLWTNWKAKFCITRERSNPCPENSVPLTCAFGATPSTFPRSAASWTSPCLICKEFTRATATPASSPAWHIPNQTHEHIRRAQLRHSNSSQGQLQHLGPLAHGSSISQRRLSDLLVSVQ